MLQPKKEYKSVFIDLDDTLWDTETNCYVGLEQFFNDAQIELIVSVPFKQFASVYFENNTKLWNLYHQALIDKAELIVRRFKDSFIKFGVNLSDKQALKYNKQFLDCTSSQTQLVPYALELLEYLKPKYPIFLLSNGFEEVQYLKIKNSGLEPYFDHVILSDHIGYTKPHPKLFEHALSLTDSKINTSIMIGDNFSTDIIGAQQIMMDQVYFSPSMDDQLPFKPTYWINHLQEIKHIL